MCYVLLWGIVRMWDGHRSLVIPWIVSWPPCGAFAWSLSFTE